MISVIIPVFNAERTLKKCVNSVLNQDYGNFELIIVDNNSYDKSKEIIKCFKDKRIKYVFEKNKGRGFARNAGIRSAEGKIIAMIDADCIAPEGWLKMITSPIITDEELIVVGNEKIEGEDYVSTQRERSKQEFRNSLADGKYTNHLDTKNCAFNRAALRNIRFDNKMKSKEDVDLGIRLLAFDPEIKDVEDMDLGMNLLVKKIKFLYLRNLKVGHNHPLTLFQWVRQVAEKGYYLEKSFDKNKKILHLLPENSYNQMSWKEFLSIFYNAPMSLIFMKNKKDVFFDVIVGFSYRLGKLKYKLLK